MANSEKTAAVAEITESFRGATAALLTEYRGLSVSEITQLRRALGSGTQYAVVKNTLTKIAAAEAGVTGLDELLSGPTAIAFVSGDPVEAAKGLRDFAKAHPMLVVKGGVLDGNPLSAAEIAKLADLESREVLLAKLAGAMKGTLSQAVGLFAAPLSQAARVFGALEAKAQADPSVLAGGAGAPTEPAAVAAPEATEATDATDATEATGATESAEAVVAEAIAPQPETEAAPAAEVATDETPAAPAAVESSEPAEEIVAAAIAPQPEPDAPASEPDPADAPASEGETE